MTRRRCSGGAWGAPGRPRNYGRLLTHRHARPRFGHCTQDLLNLMLIGRAVPNVFDGCVSSAEGRGTPPSPTLCSVMPLGDSGLALHGVEERAMVGYLTQLEALRYCSVGHNLKTPWLPIWVLASSSHFSVLFSLSPRANQQSIKVRSAVRGCGRRELGGGAG